MLEAMFGSLFIFLGVGWSSRGLWRTRANRDLHLIGSTMRLDDSLMYVIAFLHFAVGVCFLVAALA